ncbi:dead deah box helicase domain-containing protein [Cyclospora cayetanensis]|uniref:DNA 3'-5' helicase n=1 Tax=Cyclospora cayetanensis TaxID=88456 RepID=A0A1D3D6M7_9EIME|nr:dead deah box helicase domain-containing protein [Cyclospora cayetanensis]
MEDQQKHMQRIGFKVARLDSSLPKAEVRRVYADLRSKAPETQVLMVTAETLVHSSKLSDALNELNKRRLLRLFVVDEAHLVSQWGEDFREEYTCISSLKRSFPSIPLLALTASATPELERRVQSLLGVSAWCSFRMSCDRPNLFLEVHRKTKETVAYIAATVTQPPLKGCCGLIYCLSTKDCETLAKQLSERGVRAVPYHAKLSHAKRLKVSTQWSEGTPLVVCCTVAFGLGIDRADAASFGDSVALAVDVSRCVTLGAFLFFAFCCSVNSPHRYYQEIGRAGRDGAPSRCILFYLPHDATRLAKLHAQKTRGNGLLSRSHHKVFFRRRGRRRAACGASELPFSSPSFSGSLLTAEARKAKSLAEMQHYCELHMDCRRKFLLKALDEDAFPATPAAAPSAEAGCNAQSWMLRKLQEFCCF